jgi:alkylation response protein AidB-like acyl-CoA dehydrogenase
MAIGITEEHEELRRAARRFLESRCPPDVPRALLDAPVEARPRFWAELAAQGWLGLHVPEALGGQGYGLLELAVVLEELGRAVAPGPFLTTALAAAIVAEADGARGAVLRGLLDGATPGAVVLDPDAPVLGAALARVVLVPQTTGDDDGGWAVFDVDAGGIEVEPVPSLDPTRRVAVVRVTGAPEHVLRGVSLERARALAAVMVAAECAGGAGWCLETTSAYAKVREQFGRPIGQFQAVKHRLADMLIVVEQMRATVWDAARAAAEPETAALPAAAAAAIGLDGFVQCAKDAIQLHGGIGFTWEHDAHLYLKRAMSLRSLFGTASTWRARVATLALAGERRALDLELPPEADQIRAEVQIFLDGIAALDRPAKRARMVEEGYLVPNWPRPWGRDAGAIEQLVIDEEFRKARIRRPHLAVGAWALPTIITHGTAEQQDRWVRPTLLGELSWCRMFSEPGAGSDLAALSTKAVPTTGGWLLSGQKVWTSMAREADLAICLARTNADAPKHLGITYFIVDMRSDGLDIRPLRELTGVEWFNEIFLSDVFVPDDCVIGAVDGGWPLARNTLANERVSMGSGSSFGYGVEALLGLVEGTPAAGESLVLDRLGALLAEAQSLALFGYRSTARSVSGADPDPAESSVRKLLGVEHEQRVQELGLELLGPSGATTAEGEAAMWTNGFLANRCLTIAGGTSEVQRNLIAERVLGLPRDP